jgi:hypothetical protein
MWRLCVVVDAERLQEIGHRLLGAFAIDGGRGRGEQYRVAGARSPRSHSRDSRSRCEVVEGAATARESTSRDRVAMPLDAAAERGVMSGWCRAGRPPCLRESEPAYLTTVIVMASW